MTRLTLFGWIALLWLIAAGALVTAAAGVALVFYLGEAPQLIGRMLPLDLVSESQIFRDWRIAALSSDRDLCRQVLSAPNVRFTVVDDKTAVDGCGWSNAVRLDMAAGIAMRVEPISCPMAAGLALWLSLIHI